MNKRPTSSLFAALVLCLQALSAGAADLAIIDLQHRSAAEVLPVLRPLVGADVALSGTDYKLIVRGNPADVARIREALAVIDRAPKQLLVSVRYTGSPNSNTSEFSAGALRNRSNTANGESANERQIIAHGGVTTSTASDSNVSSVRVLEGNGAHIATGQSVPVITAYRVSSGNRPGAGIAADYRELTTGFDVLPRVNGARIMLDISTQQQSTTDLSSSSAAVHYTTTTIAGRLGEWIELGGVASSFTEQGVNVNANGGTRRTTTQSDQRTVMVKVEQVD